MVPMESTSILVFIKITPLIGQSIPRVPGNVNRFSALSKKIRKGQSGTEETKLFGRFKYELFQTSDIKLLMWTLLVSYGIILNKIKNM
jgi:hypothetical protein